MSGTDQLSAHLDRGWDLLNRAEFESALYSAEKALELDPEAPEGHFLMGTIAARHGRTRDALRHFHDATLLDDGYVDAFLAAAEVHLHPLQDTPGCLELCDEVLSFVQDPRDIADAILLKFEALLACGEHARGSALLEELPKTDFGDGSVHYRIGWALHEVDRPSEARIHLERALELNTRNSDAHYYLGVLEADRGDLRAAIGHWLCSRELDEEETRAVARRWNPEVERLAREVQEGLPEPLRKLLEGVRFVVTQRPGAELVAEGTDPRLGVYFAGLAEGMGEKQTDSEHPPAVRLEAVFVYSANLVRAFPVPKALRAELRNAIAHEASHFFDLSEEEMERMGLGGLHRFDHN